MQGGRECGEFKKLKWIVHQKKQNHPAKRWGHTSVIHDGKLMIFGGNHSGSPHEGLHRINCDTLENIPLNFPVQPEVRESHSCVAHHDSLYIYGGCIEQETSEQYLFVFNPLTQLTNELLQLKIAGPAPTCLKIEQKNPIPPRESHVTALVDEKFMLIYGGTNKNEAFLDEFWLLDLEQHNWMPVRDVQGAIEAKIGISMTPIGQSIYAFGGQYGEGEDSQYSNDLNRLAFDDEIRLDEDLPTLVISKVQTSGVRPNPRTGHASIDYKGKMLIVIGGQGVSSKRASILYNDVWTFDLRNLSWSELPIENRTVFRPRSNFTANLYKNTIYIFGGFVNLSSFKCTDELVTITLAETRYALRQDMNARSNQNHSKLSQQSTYCSMCKFQFLEQPRKEVRIQEKISNDNLLNCSTQNIRYAAQFIRNPLEALGLVVDSCSRIGRQADTTLKLLEIDLIFSSKTGSSMEIESGEASYLKIALWGANPTKKQLQALALSYRCQQTDPGFDLKNGLFRLGGEFLLCELFEDRLLCGFLVTSHGITKYVLRYDENLESQLKKHQNFILSIFLTTNGIDLKGLKCFELSMFVGRLNRLANGQLQLSKDENNSCLVIRDTNAKERSFQQFITEYFLAEKFLTLKVHGHDVPLFSFEKVLRDRRSEPQQEPTTHFFSKVHFVFNEGVSSKKCEEKENQDIKLFALGRRVGSFAKYPEISGFIQLNDVTSLNYPRTRCQSLQIRQALEEEVRVLMQQQKKRTSVVTVSELEKEIKQS